MRRTRPILLTLVVSLGLVVACTIERADVRTPGGERPESDTTRVRKVIDAIARSFETGDVMSLDTLYHEDVLIYEWGSVTTGWPKYRDEHLLPELDAFENRRFIIEDRKIRLAGTTAWASFRYIMEAGPQNDRLFASGVGTMVFQKLSGRWVIVHSHTSAGY